MLKVLLDQRMDEGGAGRYGRELVQALRAMPDGPEIRAVTKDQAPPVFTSAGRRAIGRIAEQWGADVIHGLHFELPKSDIPSVVTIQDLIPLDFPASMPNPIKRKAFEMIVRSAVGRAERIIVPSRLSSESVERLNPLCLGKANIIPLSVSPLFKPLAQTEKEMARLRFGKSLPYFAAIYHGKPHKNLQVIPEAARLILARTGFTLCCLGHPLLSPVSANGQLSDDDLAVFLGGAEAFILPSLLEGFGLPVLESAACGVPSICGKDVGVLEVLDGCCRVVDVLDPDSIAKEACAIVENGTGTSSRCAEQAMARTPARLAKATLHVYRETGQRPG